MSSATGQPFLVLGMHRSGTSLLAALVQARGVFLGDRLLGASQGNRHGHFEDEAVLAFHASILKEYTNRARGCFDDGMMHAELPPDWSPGAEISEQAEELLANRRREGYWGWKEPRTCLFLDFWRPRLPGLKALAVYRHPLEVHLSCLRRGHWDLPLFPAQILEAWVRHNRPLLEFAREEPERVLLVNAKRAFADFRALASLLDERLGLPGSAEADERKFIFSDFHGTELTREQQGVFAASFPQAARLYGELQAQADLPGEQSVGSCDEKAMSAEAALLRIESLLPDEEAMEAVAARRGIVGAITEHVLNLQRGKQLLEESWDEQKRQLLNQRDENKRLWEGHARLSAGYQEVSEKTNLIWKEYQALGRAHEALKKRLAEALEGRC